MTLEDHFSIAFTTDNGVKNHFRDAAGVLREPETWWYAASTLGMGDDEPDPEKPYVAWTELDDFVFPEVRETSNARNRTFQFFVYDKKGGFSGINAIFDDLRRVVKGLDHFTTEEDEVRCSGAEWLGISAQIPDDAYDQIARFATVRFTVSR